MAIPLEHKIPEGYFEVDLKDVVAAVYELQTIVEQLNLPEPG